MAKEAEEPENDENAEAAPPPQPMFSKAGLIVLISVIVVLLAGFGVILTMISSPPEQPEALEEKAPELTVQDLNAPRLPIPNIIMSIPTNELATEFRHLKISLTVIIGRLESEKDPSFDLNVQLNKEQFLDTAEKFIPFVEDKVIKIASSYTYLELQEESTKQSFKQRLINELNQVLKKYGLPPRIKNVLWNSFIFSD